MEVKNKELKKLYDSITLYFDSWCLPSLITAFMVCDDAIEGEIAAIKAELTDAKRGRAIFRCDADRLRNIVLEKDNELRMANDEIESLKKTIDELKEKLNNECKHGEDLADVNGQLASENGGLKARLTLLEHSRITWRARAQHAEKEVEDLNKKISELEEENANLRATPDDANAIEVLKRENRVLRCDNKKLAAACEDNKRLREVIYGKEKEINTLKKRISELEKKNADDEIRIKSLERANSVLRRYNGILWAKMEEFNISKRPWHGDGNAMTGERIKSLAETIEFQNKKIEELEAEKVGKEHKENVDLSPGHEFKFGDEVFVPWSCDPYMYIKSGMMYNPRTERLVYVGKDQHLKWTGEKFEIK